MPLPALFRISKETFLRNLLITVLYGFSSAMILLLFIAHEDGISHRNSVTSEFTETIRGTAHKPSVARVLVPLMIRGTSAVTPGALKTAIQGVVKKRSAAIESLEWQEEYYFEYVAASVIMFALLMGYAFALRYLLRFYYPKDPAITNFAPVFGVLLLALFFRYRHFLYDPATLCLSTLALALIVHRKNLWYYPVFVLACLNKETTILLAGVFFVFQRGHMPIKILVRHVALQGVIWGLVQAALFVTFRNNPGSSTELHLFDHNLALIHDPLSLAYFVLVLAFFALFVMRRWKAKPLSLRQGFLILLIPELALSVLWGYFDALRVYYEAFPFALALALPSVMEVISMNERRTPSVEVQAVGLPGRVDSSSPSLLAEGQ